jgi:hypothetical protein
VEPAPISDPDPGLYKINILATFLVQILIQSEPSQYLVNVKLQWDTPVNRENVPLLERCLQSTLTLTLILTAS